MLPWDETDEKDAWCEGPNCWPMNHTHNNTIRKSITRRKREMDNGKIAYVCGLHQFSLCNEVEYYMGC